MLSAQDNARLYDALSRVAERSPLERGAEPHTALLMFWQGAESFAHTHPTLIDETAGRINDVAQRLRDLDEQRRNGHLGEHMCRLEQEHELIEASKSFLADHHSLTGVDAHAGAGDHAGAHFSLHETYPDHRRSPSVVHTHEVGGGVVPENLYEHLKSLLDEVEKLATVDGLPVAAFFKFSSEVRQRADHQPDSLHHLIEVMKELRDNLELSIQRAPPGRSLAISLGVKIGIATAKIVKGMNKAGPPPRHVARTSLSHVQSKLFDMRDMYRKTGTRLGDLPVLDAFEAAIIQANNGRARWHPNLNLNKIHRPFDEAALDAFDEVIAQMAEVRAKFDRGDISYDNLIDGLNSCITSAGPRVIKAVREAYEEAIRPAGASSSQQGRRDSFDHIGGGWPGAHGSAHSLGYAHLTPRKRLIYARVGTQRL